MQYKDLVKIKVWSIYRDKKGNRMLLPDWMAYLHISVADNFCKLRDEIKRRGWNIAYIRYV